MDASNTLQTVSQYAEEATQAVPALFTSSLAEIEPTVAPTEAIEEPTPIPTTNLATLQPFELPQLPFTTVGHVYEEKDSLVLVDLYRKDAEMRGFNVRKDYERKTKTGKLSRIRWVCSKEGLTPQLAEKKRSRPSTRTDCKAEFRIRLTTDDKWTVMAYVAEHNHDLLSHAEMRAHRSNRSKAMDDAMRHKINALKRTGAGPSQIFKQLQVEYGGHLPMTVKDVGKRFSFYFASRLFLFCLS